MLLKVTETLDIAAEPAKVFALLNDTARLAALVPGVDEIARIEDAGKEAYKVRVTEKVGPFKVTMKLEIAVTGRSANSTIGATVKGGDAMGLGRATGTIRVDLSPTALGTTMTFLADVEVLGKLVTLGAPVVRRRVTELFADFGRNFAAEFQAGQA